MSSHYTHQTLDLAQYKLSTFLLGHLLSAVLRVGCFFSLPSKITYLLPLSEMQLASDFDWLYVQQGPKASWPQYEYQRLYVLPWCLEFSDLIILLSSQPFLSLQNLSTLIFNTSFPLMNILALSLASSGAQPWFYLPNLICNREYSVQTYALQT